MDKKVLVIGSGISGIGACSLILKNGESPILYDGNTSLIKKDIIDKINKINQDYKEDIFVDTSKVTILISEDIKESIIDSIDYAVISPGVDLNSSLIVKLKKTGIKIIGEIELAYMHAKGKLIAITGTNGKTTTTALVGEIIKDYFEEAYLVGNIGIPYTVKASKTTNKSVTVAEVSSFQLETVETFKPDVSAVLNITPDHLDRHITMENYSKIKLSIAKNQDKNQFCVLNYEDDFLRNNADKLNCKTIFFSSKSQLDNGVYIKDNYIVYKDEKTIKNVINIEDIFLVGIHNLENIMAAIAMAYKIGVSFESIEKTIKNFKAVEHRIEYVTKINDVIYYNDSKGTNTDASTKAIEAMSRKTLLIAGGYDKNSEFDDWIKSFKEKIKYLILIGVTKEKIANACEKNGFKDYIMVDNLKEAVIKSFELAKKGDAVLLSPACASWDMFDSYEQRGKLFKEYVFELEKE